MPNERWSIWTSFFENVMGYFHLLMTSNRIYDCQFADINDNIGDRLLGLFEEKIFSVLEAQIKQGRIWGGLGPPLTTKNEAPAPKFYKIEAPEWQF